MEVMMDQDEKWICPNCGEKMKRSTFSDETIYVCPKCGCSVEGTEQNFDTLNCCPNCNQPLDDGNECSYCGYDLGSDFD